jgi:hypothetical protein
MVDFVRGYNFDFVLKRLLKEGMNKEAASSSVEQMRVFFMMIAAHPEERFAAWEGMDPAWHAFILHTGRYAEFCQHLVGRFVHHDPEAFGTPAFAAAWSKTVKAAAAFGIKLRPDIAAACAEGVAAACAEDLRQAA